MATVFMGKTPLRSIVSVLFLLRAFSGFAAPAAEREPVAKRDARPPRTVTWYADNPRSRASVQLACLDDPGRLGNTPDCINADRANVEVTLREARMRTGTLDPRDPAFWSNDPQNRHNKLLMCRLTPQLNYCDVAKRSLLIEAGQQHR
jgi:hypothetical protein